MEFIRRALDREPETWDKILEPKAKTWKPPSRPAVRERVRETPNRSLRFSIFSAVQWPPHTRQWSARESAHLARRSTLDQQNESFRSASVNVEHGASGRQALSGAVAPNPEIQARSNSPQTFSTFSGIPPALAFRFRYSPAVDLPQTSDTIVINSHEPSGSEPEDLKRLLLSDPGHFFHPDDTAGLIYPTAEHLYYALRFRSDERERIRDISGTSGDLFRELIDSAREWNECHFVSEDWHERRWDHLSMALESKFLVVGGDSSTQEVQQGLRDLLLRTADPC